MLVIRWWFIIYRLWLLCTSLRDPNIDTIKWCQTSLCKGFANSFWQDKRELLHLVKKKKLIVWEYATLKRAHVSSCTSMNTKLCLCVGYCIWETLSPNLSSYQTERVTWPDFHVFFVQSRDSLIFMAAIFLDIKLSVHSLFVSAVVRWPVSL